ncbi:hypothetical protein BD289DRAFT_160274 [Coniella lustricola]|uniref:Glycosyltransferase 2 n=1 Tax=Coniella lustricola TaxID=2025994 RepID=A0A2T2ZUJ4_9PEZI|nr:hypothetical protein BD289DRAFT_160274 [Coniella lustricola]
MRPKLDPELGVTKKNDDLFTKGNKTPTGWRAKSAPRVPLRKTFRRLGLLILFAVACYMFIINIPTDLGPQDRKRRPQYTHGSGSASPPNLANSQLRLSNDVVRVDVGRDAAPAGRDYDGPIRFLNLADTLQPLGDTKGSASAVLNVMFAASSLSSASRILPVACQMSQEKKSRVNFALMSRNEIPLNELREINGIGEDCDVLFHDARVEFAASSSDERFEKAITRALYHINTYMHPVAILVDSTDAEDHVFLKSIRESVPKLQLRTAIVELPAHAEQHMGWITKLEASSFYSWDFTVEILIHAHTGASGSLIRLLKSLAAADFSGGPVPHLTIELPEEIDPPTSQFLRDFDWPPSSTQNVHPPNQLTLRHRISKRSMNEEDSSVRFLEGFWPAYPERDHVLVLSPQVELSPNFYQYLKLTLLEYRYSRHSTAGAWDKRLFGISLALPSTQVSGTGPFTPPSRKLPTTAASAVLDSAEDDSSPSSSSSSSTPFLWQAPNSNAILILGERWTELHKFVAQSLEVQHSSSSSPSTHPPPALLTQKFVSKEYPAWLEHAMRLCRGRGYWTLYPSAEVATNLATVHHELYRAPEEYEDEEAAIKQHQHNGGGGFDDIGGSSAAAADDDDEIVLHHMTLLDSLPPKHTLPLFKEMPIVQWDGEVTSLKEFDENAVFYAVHFRQMVGGCEDKKALVDLPASLFCTGDDEDDGV